MLLRKVESTRPALEGDEHRDCTLAADDEHHELYTALANLADDAERVLGSSLYDQHSAPMNRLRGGVLRARSTLYMREP